MSELNNKIGIVEVNPQNESKVRVKIAEILEKNRVKILDQYYDEYCRCISLSDRKKRSIEELKSICTPVRNRFSVILDRFIGVLKSEEYDLKESEQDVEYALRFVVPGRHKELNSHDIIRMTEAFYSIATSIVLKELKQTEYSAYGEDIIKLMNKLVLIILEDLWVGSVVGFRFQHSVIQQLLFKLMMIQEEERQKLWREIHDEFLQVLAAIPLKLEIVEKLSQKDVGAMKKELNLIKTITKKTIREIRELGHGFNLFWVERKGFLFSLRRFAKLFEQRFKIPVVLDINSGVKKIKGFPGITLFRIIQEGLYNIGKHSKANYAKVSIRVLEKEVVTTIEDDGVGFDANEVIRKGRTLQHLGLVFMRERTEILNGSMKIDSMKNNGTRISINIPLNSFLKKAVSANNLKIVSASGQEGLSSK
jgi:signal transduction histidine kinase